VSKLRLLSNNIWSVRRQREAWEALGYDCSAEARAPGFARVYAELLPDVVGLQEVSDRMSRSLPMELYRQGLPYATVWGHYTPILYRTDRLELVDAVYHLYPETHPGWEGSFNDQESKSYLAAVLRVKEDGRLLIFATTHLWWRGDNVLPHSTEARTRQLSSLLDCVDALQQTYSCPAVVVGDLNTLYESDPIRAALARGYRHAHDLAVEYADEGTGYHRCDQEGFNREQTPGPFVHSIDHILLRDLPEGAVRRFDRYRPDYYMPLSDHFPVWADVEI
jgi:endonuclease/exonuclease/phosphatase family metal-dependent hydrolase